jgi:hypothetical protein
MMIFSGFFAIALLVGWLAPIVIAALITESRGRGALVGLLLGLILSWLGVVIALLLGEALEASPRVRSRLYRECPHCKERMRRDAHVCPHCRYESPAEILDDGVRAAG